MKYHSSSIVPIVSDLSIVQVLKVLHVNTQHLLTVGNLHEQIQSFIQLLLVRMHPTLHYAKRVMFQGQLTLSSSSKEKQIKALLILIGTENNSQCYTATFSILTTSEHEVCVFMYWPSL